MNIETAKTLRAGDKLHGVGFGEAHETGTVEHVFSDGVQIRCKCGQLNDKVNFDREDAYWSKIELVLEYGSYADVCRERDNLQAENHRLARRVQQQRGGLESALSIIKKWRERALFGRALVHELKVRLEEQIRATQAWKKSAEQNGRNEAYRRDLLLQIAEVLGPEKFISDDGSVQQDVLLAKVPELARAAVLAPHIAKAKATYVPAPAEPVANCQTDGCNSAAPEVKRPLYPFLSGTKIVPGVHDINDRIALLSSLKVPLINPFA